MDKVYLALYKGRASNWRERIEDWLNWQTFQNYERIVVNTSTSYSGKYEDNMVFKF